MEADHARGEPPHRPHEQIVQHEIDQRGGQHRDQQRDQNEVAGEPVDRLSQRQFVDHDLDELRPARGRAHHADRLVAVIEHDVERVGDRLPHRERTHVDVAVDRGRQVGAGEQPPLLAHLDGHRPRADAAQDVAGEQNQAPCRAAPHPARARLCWPRPGGRSAGSSGSWRSPAHRSAGPRSAPTGWSAAAVFPKGRAGAAV